MPVIGIVGMQYGSEGKGVIAELLGHISRVAIRIGGPNAGHTIDYKGTKYVMRHIPCAWTNPECKLLIGPAGLINSSVLREEIEMVEEALGSSLGERLFIHERVIPIMKEHEEAEAPLGEKIGSTREGVGAATAERAWRRADTIRGLVAKDGDYTWLKPYIISHEEYLSLVHDVHDQGYTILLEGTQGYGLSLYHGPYPFCTSRDTTIASLAGGCGIAPSMIIHTIGVVRTFPIRVAGNSGPLPYETSFQSIGREPEHTTVTKKVRRIARFDWKMFKEAVRVNRPNILAVTFLDYLNTNATQNAFVRELYESCGVRIGYLGKGPDTFELNHILFKAALERKNRRFENE